MKTNNTMNTLKKTMLCLPMTALLITTAVADPGKAKKSLPFKGTIEGAEDFNFQIGDPSGIDLLVVGEGGGIASHLGAFSADWVGYISFGPDPSAPQPLDRTFVAANGDELWSEGWGVGTPPDADPNFNQYVVEDHVITGGTGRFEGATGSFTVERVVYDVRPGVDLETEGSFDGSITLKGTPFKGVVQGTEDFNFQIGDPSGVDLVVLGDGGGSATHLGEFSATWRGDISFGPDPSAPQPLGRTFVAANGDELWSEGWGVGTPPNADPNFNQYVVEDHVITGGTGRFEGATGSFTVERVVYDVRPGVDLETEGSFDGTIILK